MGQRTGQDAAVLLGSKDVSGDGNSFSVSHSADTPETTAFGDNTRTRLPGLKDWTVEVSGFFNDDSGHLEEELKDLLGGSTLMGVFPGGATACQIGYEGTPLTSDFSLDTPVDGVVTLAATFSGSGDLWRSYVTTACTSTCTAAVSYTDGVDTGATAIECQGFLRVMDLASGSDDTLVVKIQDSPDDSAYGDLISFTSVTAGSVSETKSATGSREQYVRASYNITTACLETAEFTFIVSAT